MPDQQKNRVRGNFILGVGGCAVITGLIVLMLRTGGHGLSPEGRILLATAAVAGLVTWWAVFAVRIDRARDEYQRWVESRAWYWGGLIGLIASVPVFTFIGLGGLHWLAPSTDIGPVASRAFRLGYMLPLMMQVIGAVSVGLWWRWAKR